MLKIGKKMSVEISEEQLMAFLKRVIEIEEKYAFAKKGQDTARKTELRDLLDDFCK